MPSSVDLEHDRQRIAAWRQNRLNCVILSETRRACVSREDHRLMLKQLLSAAFAADPRRRTNLPRWRRIVLAVEKEFWGANALFTLSPDPYQQVLAKLSSMMLWNEEIRHWDYEYCTKEMERRQAHQREVLDKIKRSGKLFLPPA